MVTSWLRCSPARHGTALCARHRRAQSQAAGIYTAHAAIELYAEVFEQAAALDRLEALASFHGADFYRLPRNRDTLALEKRCWTAPEEVRFGKEVGVPLRAGKTIAWRLAE